MENRRLFLQYIPRMLLPTEEIDSSSILGYPPHQPTGYPLAEVIALMEDTIHCSFRAKAP